MISPWSRRLFATALVLLLGSSRGAAQHRPENWTRPTTPFQIIGNIYYVGTEGLAAYLITSPQGHVLLDVGLPECAPFVAKNVEALGFKLKDIKYLLNSHAHFDHGGGLAEMKRRTGAQVVASAGDRSALEGGFYLGSEKESQFRSPKVKVDRAVKDGDTVRVGDTTLTANLTPGHTRGCTSWSMSVRDGDATRRVLFFCSTSVAANRLVGPPQYPNIVKDYESTFAKLHDWPVDVFLAPHAEFFDMPRKRAQLERQPKGAPNPFVDPAEFARFLAKSEADFRVQLAAQQAKLNAK